MPRERMSHDCFLVLRQLRGCVQCLATDTAKSCFDAAHTRFAMLPKACLPGGSAETAPATVDGGAAPDDKPAQSTISVQADGTMTIDAAAKGRMTLHLDGVVLPRTPGSWGWPFLLVLIVMGVLYLGGGAGYAMQVRAAPPPTLPFPLPTSQHPHTSTQKMSTAACT